MKIKIFKSKIYTELRAKRNVTSIGKEGSIFSVIIVSFILNSIIKWFSDTLFDF